MNARDQSSPRRHRSREEVSGGRGTTAEKPTDIPARGWKEILGRVVAQLREDHVSLLAAGVAFKALLALFPAMIAAVSIWGLVADPETMTQQVEELTAALPDEAASIIEGQLTQIAGTSSGALSIAVAVSVLLALWSASAGMMGLIEGTNAAYDEADERSFFRRRGLAIVFTLGAIVFLVVTLGLIAVLPPVLDGLGLGSAAELAVQIGKWPLLAIVVMSAVALVYRYAPYRDDPQFRWATSGAVVATLLWLIGSAAFAVYVERAGNFAETYGALAGVIILMLWLYLTAFVVLFGAELNSEMERQTARDTTTGEPRPMGQRDAEVADTPPPVATRE